MQKEINKYLKRISAEKLKKNHKECIELYNTVGGLHSELGSYDEAVHYHEQALDLCKTLGDRLGTAVAFRYIGEAKAALGQFYLAIDYTKKYLDLALKLHDRVEIQRAWTTLGRVHLMQAQDLKDKNNVTDQRVKDAALEAEKRFNTALNLADSIREQIDEKEFAEMKSGLLVNIGLVKDICGQNRESEIRFQQAIDICKKSKLKENLFRCQNILSGIYRNKNNIKKAVMTSEEALTTAKSIGKKILICDAYIEKGLVKICQRDFKNAKRAFAQAYLEKSPNEEDHSKAIRLTKLAHLISTTHDKLRQEHLTSHTKMELCDKLGDLFVAINSYKLAIEFYKRAFAEARVCSQPRAVLAKILYSIAETYADDEQFEHAMICYEKEIGYRNGNDAEQCQSWVKIAHMREYQNQDIAKISEAYEKALEKAGNDVKLMYNVLKYYVPCLEKASYNRSRCQELENKLDHLKSFQEVQDEIEIECEEESNDIEDEVPNIDDIITDDEDNDEVQILGRRRARGRNKFKSNEVGDTPLHEACIKGDLKRVKALISQGHEVNPRDNAGWIPLHEACNHGHYEIVDHLIENGADVSNRGLNGMTPLHDAATNGHFEIMRLLIKNGANVIALTDIGETVLACLRDYKKRNYSDMSNNVRSEYIQMEAELLNLMDKCGHSLIEEKVRKSNSTRSESASTHSTVPRTEVRVRRKDPLAGLVESEPSNSVKDYRNVIGTLKRKHIDRDQHLEENVKKANLPPTYHAGHNPSVSTKEWVIDDVSRHKQLSNRTNLQQIIQLDDEMSDDEVSSVRFSDVRSSEVRSSIVRTSDVEKSDVEESDVENSDVRFSDDPKSDDEIELVEEPQEEPINREPPKQSNYYKESNGFDLKKNPLKVTIGGRRLLIPVKDELATIKWLKESIVERYSALVEGHPIINVAPVSDPRCILFDGDLCHDVLQENVIATIEGWKLDSIVDSYIKQCEKLGLNAMNFIKAELRRIESVGNKLDLSYTRIGRSHVKAVASALAHRDFAIVDFTGSFGLFDTKLNGQELLRDTMSTWRRLTELTLKCIGLRRHQFESIYCNESMRLAQLEKFDVSTNLIVYKCRVEFKEQVRKLRRACPNLKRLDMRRNHLQFAKSICRAGEESGKVSELLFDLSACGEGYDDEQEFVASSEFELLLGEQYEYSVYSA